MTYLLLTLLGLPLVAATTIILLFKGDEHPTYWIASKSALLLIAATVVLLILWVAQGCQPFEAAFGDIYSSSDYRFPFTLYFDTTSAVFVGVITFISAIIVKYCRYYMHRENRYGSFFATILVFLSGIYLLVLAGTLDLLFAGWEIVGISSFLLIGFYWERQGPTENAIRTYSVYRLCDVGLLMGAWLGHLIWHQTQHFSMLAKIPNVFSTELGMFQLMGLSFLILLAAAGKSAQFPFCFWLPRAMEGPTPSSAIFYGALSIHCGVYLLLRTYPIWSVLPVTRISVAVLGLSTAVFATLASRVQSNIKASIAYASITQVGLMLIEVAAGWHAFVLLHFVGNASLRCYQLLVSPSVVAHLIRMQSSAFTHERLLDWRVGHRLPVKITGTLYALSLQDGFLEPALKTLLWRPLVRAGRVLDTLFASPTRKAAVALGGLFLLIGIFYGQHRSNSLALGLGLLMLLASLVAAGEARSPWRVWLATGTSVMLAGLAVAIADPHSFNNVWVYFAGVIPSWLLGAWMLHLLNFRPSTQINLRAYSARATTQPQISFWFFVAFLGVTGFPITPAFLGEDLLLHYAIGDHLWLAACISFIFVVNGITLVRLYSHLCLGERNSEMSTP